MHWEWFDAALILDFGFQQTNTLIQSDYASCVLVSIHYCTQIDKINIQTLRQMLFYQQERLW